MKRFVLYSAAALCALASGAQLNGSGDRGLIDRAVQMASTGNIEGALDQSARVDRKALSTDELRTFELDRAGWLFAAGRFDEARAAYSRFLTDRPFDTDRQKAAMGIADCLFATGDVNGAREAYEAVDPAGLTSTDAALYYYRAGVTFLETGDTDRAESFFERAANDELTRQDALFYLGTIAYNAGNYSLARKRFKGVGGNPATAAEAEFYLTAIDFAEGSYSRALSQARQLLRRQGLSATTTAELNRIAGESAYKLDDSREALVYLEKYIAATPEAAPTSLYIAGLAAFDRGDYARALELLQPVTERGEGAVRQSAYLYAGQCLLEEGDTAAAIMAFDKAAHVDDDKAVREAAFYNYAAARFSGASVPFASAADTFEEFLRLYPSGPYSDRVAAFLAEGYMADNDYIRALQRLDAIANPSPHIQAARQRVLYTLGTTALADNKLGEAQGYLDRAEAGPHPDRNVARETTLSQARLMLRQQRYKEAATRFHSYLRSAPADAVNRPVALYGLAYACYGANDAVRAEEFFSRAKGTMATAAANADVLDRLGDLSFAAGAFDRAADYYAQALKTHPAAGDYPALGIARMKGYMRDYSGKLDALYDFDSRYASSALMPEAMLERTQALISLGRNDDAIAVYRSLIDRYPTTAQGRRGYLQMAMTLLDTGRREQAAQAYRDVITRYPTSDEALQAASLLKIMLTDDGRGAEYLDFMAGVSNAPAVSADEAEQLAFDSACRAFELRADTSQLRDFAGRYPASPRAPQALGMLLTASGGTDTALEVAKRILERYPDSNAAEEALAVVADRALATGDMPAAQQAYRTLADRASDASMATRARLGVMRTARDMGQMQLAGEMADAIATSSAGAEAVAEANFTKALALDADGNAEAAIAMWLDLAKDSSTLFGAKSAFEAARALHENGKHDRALKVAQDFVQSGSAQRYWVARGFILISDIYAAKGKEFEAKEYLNALKDNYPGSEADIFMMIDSRLNNDKEQ